MTRRTSGRECPWHRHANWPLPAGPAVLTTFRRAARKARFRASVRFAAPALAPPADSDGP